MRLHLSLKNDEQKCVFPSVTCVVRLSVWIDQKEESRNDKRTYRGTGKIEDKDVKKRSTERPVTRTSMGYVGLLVEEKTGKVRKS